MTAKCHFPIYDPQFNSLHTANGGPPPAGHNPAPQIITDPELIAQLRNAMSSNPTKKNQRKTAIIAHELPQPLAEDLADV